MNNGGVTCLERRAKAPCGGTTCACVPTRALKAQDRSRCANPAAVSEAWGGVVGEWVERQIGAQRWRTSSARSSCVTWICPQECY